MDEIDLEEAKKYLVEGHFLRGSMEPKVRACIRFLERGGRKAVITSVSKVVEGFKGSAGTIIRELPPT